MRKINNAVGPQDQDDLALGLNWKLRTRIIFVFLCYLAGIWTATQAFASIFQYDIALGPNIKHIYFPISILKWAFSWFSAQPELRRYFYEAAAIGITVSAAGLLVMLFMLLIKVRDSRPNRFLHGSARWADKNDIKNSGLLSGEGVFVGGWMMPENGIFGDKKKMVYLRHNGPEHILCYAPTRSGKGVGLVVPTMLTWPHSAVITDLKGELWAMTAGWRQQYAKNIVLRFEPAATKQVMREEKTGKILKDKFGNRLVDVNGNPLALPVSVCWNPLDEIRLGEYDPNTNMSKTGTDKYEISDVQNLATLVVDPDGKGLVDHWQKTGQALLVGCLLYLLYERRRWRWPEILSEMANQAEQAARKFEGEAAAATEYRIKTRAREAAKKVARECVSARAAIPAANDKRKQQEDNAREAVENEYEAAKAAAVTAKKPEPKKTPWQPILKASLSDLDKLLAEPPYGTIRVLWERMRDTYPGTVIARAAQDMLDRPEKEGGSVLSTVKSFLSLYRDPIVAANTSASQFKIEDLMNSEKPVSLYIITQPTDKDRLKPLVRVMLNMIIRLQAKDMEFVTTDSGIMAKGNYKHRQLLMIDEFPSLGKLGILQESLAFIAGYGMKAYLITQDINQLRSRETGYGPDETISSNCHVQNAYPPNRVETAEHLSKLTGQTTIVKESFSTSGKRLGFLGQVSKQTNEVQRPLLTVDECLRLPGPRKSDDGKIEKAGDMVVYVAGYPAIYGRQALYFEDPILKERSKVKPPVLSDICRPYVKSDWGIERPKLVKPVRKPKAASM